EDGGDPPLGVLGAAVLGAQLGEHRHRAEARGAQGEGEAGDAPADHEDVELARHGPSANAMPATGQAGSFGEGREFVVDRGVGSCGRRGLFSAYSSSRSPYRRGRERAAASGWMRTAWSTTPTWARAAVRPLATRPSRAAGCA